MLDADVLGSPGRRLQVQVLDDRSKPVAGARVHYTDGSEGMEHAETDAKGQARIADRAGRYSVSLTDLPADCRFGHGRDGRFAPKGQWVVVYLTEAEAGCRELQFTVQRGCHAQIEVGPGLARDSTFVLASVKSPDGTWHVPLGTSWTNATEGVTGQHIPAGELAFHLDSPGRGFGSLLLQGEGGVPITSNVALQVGEASLVLLGASSETERWKVSLAGLASVGDPLACSRRDLGALSLLPPGGRVPDRLVPGLYVVVVDFGGDRFRVGALLEVRVGDNHVQLPSVGDARLFTSSMSSTGVRFEPHALASESASDEVQLLAIDRLGASAAWSPVWTSTRPAPWSAPFDLSQALVWHSLGVYEADGRNHRVQPLRVGRAGDEIHLRAFR